MPSLSRLMPTTHLHRLVQQHLEVLERPGLDQLADVLKQARTNLDRLLVCVGERHILEDFPSLMRAFEDLKYREHIGASAIIQRLFATGLDDLCRCQPGGIGTNSVPSYCEGSKTSGNSSLLIDGLHLFGCRSDSLARLRLREELA